MSGIPDPRRRRSLRYHPKRFVRWEHDATARADAEPKHWYPVRRFGLFDMIKHACVYICPYSSRCESSQAHAEPVNIDTLTCCAALRFVCQIVDGKQSARAVRAKCTSSAVHVRSSRLRFPQHDFRNRNIHNKHADRLAYDCRLNINQLQQTHSSSGRPHRLHVDMLFVLNTAQFTSEPSFE